MRVHSWLRPTGHSPEAPPALRQKPQLHSVNQPKAPKARSKTAQISAVHSCKRVPARSCVRETARQLRPPSMKLQDLERSDQTKLRLTQQLLQPQSASSVESEPHRHLLRRRPES